MSKAVKLSFAILILLLLFSLGFAGYTLLEKQKVERQKGDLENELKIAKTREEKYILDNKKIEEQLKKVEEERAKIQQDFAAVDERVKRTDEDLKKVSQERDEWKARLETIQKERDDLAAKLKEQASVSAEPKIVYKYIERPLEPKPEEEKKEEQGKPKISFENLDDSYWAQVLKEKAAIEVELENLKKEASSAAVEIAELKKQNNDLQLELGKLKTERETIDREIKAGKDLADTLSMELARTKGDNKFMSERTDKLIQESDDLRNQIKALTSTKIALEKTIVKMSDDKKNLGKKLTDTESMVESKIAEIWQIKESLNNQVKELATATKEVELPPIVVSAGNTGPKNEDKEKKATTAGLDGSIVSVNEENNFVIIDKGQGAGLNVGNKLNVYRNADYIAQVEVIQVRPDIAAADIKEKKTKIKVGDSVR